MNSRIFFLILESSMQTNNNDRIRVNLPDWLKSDTVLVILLILCTAVLYSNTLQSPFVLDDFHNILANEPIRITEITYESLRTVVRNSLIENRPVANISLAMNYYFHQYNVLGFHLFNITVHILACILLYFFIRNTIMLSQCGSPHEAKWLGFVTALIWLVHPLQTQSVTYIIQRMNSLAALFYILSFVFDVIFFFFNGNQSF